MELYINNDQLEQLEAELSVAQGAARLAPLVSLAWHLHQRDTRRAVILAGQADKLLAQADSADTTALGLRLTLLRSYAALANAEFDTCTALAQQALQGFIQLGDTTGCFDCHWVLSDMAYDQNDILRLSDEVRSASTYRSEPNRVAMTQATLAYITSLSHPLKAQAQWATHFAQLSPGAPSMVAAWMEAMQGRIANHERNHAEAIQHFHQAYTLFLDSGQIKTALFTTFFIAKIMERLDEHPSALEWMQRGLELARHTGWPLSIASALTYNANTLRLLHQFDLAHDLLLEALSLISIHKSPYRYALTLRYLGEVELEQQRHELALSAFMALELHANDLKHPRLGAIALRGQAHAALHLDRPLLALQAAHALQDSANIPFELLIDRYCLLAEIHTRHPELAPAGGLNCDAPIHYWRQALALANNHQCHAKAAQIYTDLAAAYAGQTLYHLAYEATLAANAQRLHSQQQQATNRAIAIELNHQTKRSRLENAHHQQLAASQAKRAAMLQHTSATLEFLSLIGQEITTHLDAKPVFDMLKRHIQNLLQVDVLAIFLMDGNAGSNTSNSSNSSTLAFGLADGHPLPKIDLTPDHSDPDLARCALERREVLIDCGPDTEPARRPWHSIAARSCLYTPLCQGEHLLGVMTIQSRLPQAYGEHGQLIFRTLSAYTAIALSNAQTHGELAQALTHLENTQQQMITQGKMAGLGTLTAGVAHEINNPANFLHVAGQNLLVDVQEFETFLNSLVDDNEAPDLLAAFGQHFSTLNGHVKTMLNGTTRIKTIVQDLRSFTHQGEAEKNRILLSLALNSTLNLVRTSWQTRVEFICEFEDDPLIECWPALLNQVFMNLLVNACQAIDEKQRQQASNTPLPLWLRLRSQSPWLCIEFEDSGIGIQAQACSRIMEPFYTTKAVGTGTGLGLSIAYGIVEKHGGRLDFRSEYGVGSCFTIRLPLTAPDQPDKLNKLNRLDKLNKLDTLGENDGI